MDETWTGHSISPTSSRLLRVILVPVVFWLLITGQTQARLRAVHRRRHLRRGRRLPRQDASAGRRELGAYLDPLADKLLIVSIFLALGVDGKLPLWLVVAVVSRDILIVIAVLLSWVLGHPMRIRPLIVSKANTVAQIVARRHRPADEGFQLGLGWPRFVLVWLTGALTVRIARCLFAQLAATYVRQ